MFVHHWSEYIVDPSEGHWYRFWVRKFNDFYAQEKRSKFQKLALFERLIKDVYIVAKNAKSKRGNSSGFTSDIRWINVPITDDDSAQVIGWLDTQYGDIIGYTCGIAERGFCISLKPGRNDDYMCTIYGVVGDDNSRETIGVSAYATDAGDALGVCVYKFVVLLNWGAAIPAKEDTTTRRFR